MGCVSCLCAEYSDLIHRTVCPSFVHSGFLSVLSHFSLLSLAIMSHAANCLRSPLLCLYSNEKSSVSGLGNPSQPTGQAQISLSVNVASMMFNIPLFTFTMYAIRALFELNPYTLLQTERNCGGAVSVCLNSMREE